MKIDESRALAKQLHIENKEQIRENLGDKFMMALQASYTNLGPAPKPGEPRGDIIGKEVGKDDFLKMLQGDNFTNLQLDHFLGDADMISLEPTHMVLGLVDHVMYADDGLIFDIIEDFEPQELNNEEHGIEINEEKSG